MSLNQSTDKLASAWAWMVVGGSATGYWYQGEMLILQNMHWVQDKTAIPTPASKDQPKAQFGTFISRPQPGLRPQSATCQRRHLNFIKSRSPLSAWAYGGLHRQVIDRGREAMNLQETQLYFAEDVSKNGDDDHDSRFLLHRC